tara:strand:- start:78 stop:272 length:195 start_codon:yes stop_codon:yes gene_type:complete
MPNEEEIMQPKARKVKAKITRTVTEIAIVYLDTSGQVVEYEETHEELESEVTDLIAIHEVLSVH